MAPPDTESISPPGLAVHAGLAVIGWDGVTLDGGAPTRRRLAGCVALRRGPP